MSVDAGLTVRLCGDQHLNVLLEALLSNNWSAAHPPDLEFVLTGDRSDEIVRLERDKLSQLPSRLTDWLSHGRPISTSLLWSDSGVGGGGFHLCEFERPYIQRDDQQGYY